MMPDVRYPDIPCRDASTAACVPFPANDPVRRFYAQHGMVFEERCVYCRRIIAQLHAADVLGYCDEIRVN